jgi:protein NRD1
VKHGISGDAYTQPGNCATFLLKVGGVVEGLFQDMVTSGSSESKVSQFKLVTLTEPLGPCRLGVSMTPRLR